MNRHRLFKRRRDYKASWFKTRVQYGSVNRRQLARIKPVASAPPTNTATFSWQSTLGLVVITVALYVLGLAIGGAQPVRTITDMPLEQRNATVAQALVQHPVQQLVGSFDRLLTMPRAGNTTLTDASVGCPTAASARAAKAQGYGGSSFAYLVDTTPIARTGRTCSLQAVAAAYGRPSAVTVISGTAKQPQEALLFYDNGLQRRHPYHPSQPQPVVKPAPDMAVYDSVVQQLAIPDLPPSACPGHDTIVQMVAHEDDDILFMNPDLLHAIQQGSCIRTVFLTAGDAGNSKYYWLSRERGAEAAYASMAGLPDEWTTQTVRLGDHRYATIATLNADNGIALIFLHLPDGGAASGGFGATGYESLARLVSGEIPALQTVDGQSTYTKDELVDALQKVLYAYQPTELRTQLPYNHSTVYSDHSDHLTTGQLATTAYTAFHADSPGTRLAYYTGYPIRELPANVGGDDLYAKEQAFFAYGSYDPFVCSTMSVCAERGDYGDYLQRQYRTDP